MGLKEILAKRDRLFLYEGSERGAQPEVIEAILRFRALPVAQRSATSLWAWLLGQRGTPPYKMAREWIKWSKTPVAGRNCGNCQRFYVHAATGTGICDIVRGTWEAQNWCERWEKPTSSASYEAYQR